MIVVRRIQNRFVLQLRIRPFQLRHNISRNERPQLARQMRLQAHGQFHRLELPRLRPLVQLIQIHSRHSDQLFRHIQLNPRRRFQLRRSVPPQIRPLRPPRVPHHIPSITRQIRTMNNQRRNRAMPRRLFEFVRPPPVIRQCLPFEKFLVRRLRLIHKQQRDLPFQIHALIVVPPILRRRNAKSHKHNRRINFRFFFLRLVVRHNFILILQRNLRPIRWRNRKSTLRARFHSNHRHFLKKRSFVSRGLQSEPFKLFCNPLRRRVATFLSRPAPFKLISRQFLHILANLLRLNFRLRRRKRTNRQTRSYTHHRKRNRHLPSHVLSQRQPTKFPAPLSPHIFL